MIVKVTCFQVTGGLGNPFGLLDGIRRIVHDAGGDEATTIEASPKEVTYTKKGAILTVYGDDSSLELLLSGIIGAHLRARLYGGKAVTVDDGELELRIRLECEDE